MAAGLQRLFGGDKASVSPAANGPADAPAPPAADGSAVRFQPIVPPWHLRNARALIAAAALGTVAGAAFVGYQAWQLYFNPLDRVLASRVPPAPDPAPAPPVVVPAVASPLPQPARAPVTHTLREADAARATAGLPVDAGGKKPDPARPGCGEGVAALGLCASETATEAR